MDSMKLDADHGMWEIPSRQGVLISRKKLWHNLLFYISAEPQRIQVPKLARWVPVSITCPRLYANDHKIGVRAASAANVFYTHVDVHDVFTSVLYLWRCINVSISCRYLGGQWTGGLINSAFSMGSFKRYMYIHCIHCIHDGLLHCTCTTTINPCNVIGDWWKSHNIRFCLKALVLLNEWKLKNTLAEVLCFSHFSLRTGNI